MADLNVPDIQKTTPSTDTMPVEPINIDTTKGFDIGPANIPSEPSVPDVQKTMPTNTVTPTNDLNGGIGTEALQGANATDDLTPQVMGQLQDKQTQDNLNFTLPPRKGTDPAKAKPTEPVDSGDSLGIRLWKAMHDKEALNMGASMNRDISNFVTHPQKSDEQLMGGVQDAVANAYNSLDGIAIWLNDNVPGLAKGGDAIASFVNKQFGANTMPNSEDLKAGKDRIPTASELGVPAPESVTAGLARSATQFMVGFIPTLKTIKVLTWAGDAWKGIDAVRAVLASASAGVTFAPHEQNLFNMMETWTKDAPQFVQAIVHHLAAQPGDSESDGRLKNALGAMGLTAIGEGFVAALGALKFARQAKGPTAGVAPPAASAADYTPAVRVTTAATPKEGVMPLSKEAWAAQIKQNDEAIAKAEQNILENGAPSVTLANGKVLRGKVGETHNDVVVKNNLTDADFPDGAKHFNYYLPEGDPAMVQANRELQDLKDMNADAIKKALKAKTSREMAAADAAKQPSTTKVYPATAEAPTHAEVVKALPKEEQVPNATHETGYVNKAGEFHTAQEMNDAIAKANEAQAKAIAKASALKFVGKPGQGFISQEAHDAYVAGKGSLQKVMDSVNLGSITSANNIGEAINRIATLIKVSGKFEAKPVDIVDKLNLTNKLGTTPLQMANTHPNILNDPALFSSVNKIIDASRDSIIRQATAITADVQNATSEGVLYNFTRMLNNHRAMLHWLKTGDTDAVNGMLKDTPVPTGDVSAQVNQMASSLATKGGAKGVRDLAKAIGDKAEGEGRAAAASLFERSIKNSMFKSISGILQQWWYFNLLSNPISHARNIIGNTGNFAFQIPVRALAAQVNKLARDPHGVQVGEANQLFFGYMGSMKDAWQIAREAYKTGKLSDATSKLDKEVPNYLTADKFGWTGNSGKVIDALGKVAIAPGRALMAADEFFKILAKGGETRALALRDGVSKNLEGDALKQHIDTVRLNPSDEMVNEAQHFGRELTFTADLGKFGNALQALVNRGGIVAKVVVPFVRTSANIFKEGIAVSPFNYTSPISPLGRLVRTFNSDMASGGARAQLATAKFLIGSSVSALVTVGVLNDEITGYGPVDPGLRETWLKTHVPYSIWIPETPLSKGQWVSYASFVPVAWNIGVTASLAESFGPQKAEDWATTIGHASLATSRSALSQTWVQDMSKFLEVAFDPLGHGAQNWLNQTASTFVVPGAFSWLSHILDPNYREVSNPAEAITAKVEPIWHELANFAAKVRGQTPGLSPTLPPSRNRWAQPIFSAALGPDIISPIYQYIPDGRKINQWLEDNQVPLNMPPLTQFGKDGHGGIKLTPMEYDHMLVLSAQTLKNPQSHKNMYDTLEDMVTGHGPFANQWKHLTPGPYGGQAMMIQGIIQEFDSAALAEMRNPHSQYYEKDMTSRLNLSMQQKGFNLMKGPGSIQ